MAAFISPCFGTAIPQGWEHGQHLDHRADTSVGEKHVIAFSIVDRIWYFAFSVQAFPAIIAAMCFSAISDRAAPCAARETGAPWARRGRFGGRGHRSTPGYSGPR